MAKERFHITAEEEVLDQFKAIAERMQWPFTVATEVALRLFIEAYSNVQLPGLAPIEAPEPSPEAEQVCS